MKPVPSLLILALVSALPAGLFAAARDGAAATPRGQQPSSTSYLITNDDSAGKGGVAGGTFFPIGANGALTTSSRVSLGGSGVGGGYFSVNRISFYQNSSDACAFMSIAGSGQIGAVDINAMQDIGNFLASSTDSARDNGIGLVNNGVYLYANYTYSSTIATFAILPGCSLSFLGDTPTLGLQSGLLKGMAIHGNMLVVTYGDGSIESFNASAGIPVSNNDLENSAGYAKNLYPVGVDITQDGHYAIFGDQSTTTDVEVADISSGKLAPTNLYHLGNAGNSASVYLSPDETLIYITNTGDGRVTAAFFNATTGVVTPGCTSARLKRFDTTWTFLDSPIPELNTGTGSVLYMAEFGNPSTIGIVNVTSTGTTCSLIEAAGSPVTDPNSTTLLTIGVFPPRQF